MILSTAPLSSGRWMQHSICAKNLFPADGNPDPWRLVLEEELLEKPSWESDLDSWNCVHLPLGESFFLTPTAPTLSIPLRWRKFKGNTHTEGIGMGHYERLRCLCSGVKVLVASVPSLCLPPHGWFICQPTSNFAPSSWSRSKEPHS